MPVELRVIQGGGQPRDPFEGWDSLVALVSKPLTLEDVEHAIFLLRSDGRPLYLLPPLPKEK